MRLDCVEEDMEWAVWWSSRWRIGEEEGMVALMRQLGR